jgi:preprotein translocase subunit YajC
LADFHLSSMVNLLHNIILPLAQADGAAPKAPDSTFMIIFWVLLFGGMYFLMIAPQQKKQKEHKRMLEELKRGDHVVTSGGIYGEITSVKPDRFVVKIADNTRVELNRSFIQSKVSPAEEK